MPGIGIGIGVGYRRRGGLGPVLNVSACENDDYTTFAATLPTGTGFDATSDGTTFHEAGTADEIPFVIGEKYKVEFDLVLNSGFAPRFNLRVQLGGSNISVEGAQTPSAGSNSFDFTSTLTTTGIVNFFNSSQATDFELTNLSVRHIL